MNEDVASFAVMNVYFISGVGADRRIFYNIKLPPGYAARHLDWIPHKPEETLVSYAQRLAAGIDKTQPFVLVGLSFGGMLANEIDKLYPAKLVILISSIPASPKLPPYFKLAGKIGLQKIVPIRLLKSMSLLKRLFTAETRNEKKFLREAIKQADPDFIRWSLDAIVNWRQEVAPSNYIHIHGSEDLILPVRYTGCSHLIKKGGHLMILTRSAEISNMMQKEFTKLEKGSGRILHS